MKGILKAKSRNTSIPEDSLASNSLACKFYSQTGLPETADSIAYDPVQKLLAVGCLQFTVSTRKREIVTSTRSHFLDTQTTPLHWMYSLVIHTASEGELFCSLEQLMACSRYQEAKVWRHCLLEGIQWAQNFCSSCQERVDS